MSSLHFVHSVLQAYSYSAALSVSPVGPPLSCADLGRGREGDIQNLSRVLESLSV